MKLFEFNWECQRCNACCTQLRSGVPILLSDVRRISRSKHVSVQRFLDHYCDYEVTYDAEEDLHIPFLTLKLTQNQCVLFGGSGCSVHEGKPYYCKAAPVTSMMFTQPGMRAAYWAHCKGYGRGRRFTIAEIEAQLEVERRLESEDVLELEKLGHPLFTR